MPLALIMRDAMTIYVDEVFVINLLMDFVLLWSVGRLGKLSYSKKSLILGAMCGGLYAVVIFLPIGQWLAGIGGKILCSFFMVLIAYSASNWRGVIKALAYLYLVAFVMGGSVIGAMYLFGEPFLQTWSGVAMVRIDFQLVWLIFGILAAVFLAVRLRKPLVKDLHTGMWLVDVTVHLSDKLVVIKALMDTGNQLSDPISHFPVILVEYQKLQGMLPDGLYQLFQKEKLPAIDELLLSLEGSNLAYRARIIPFHGVGQENGMLMGIRPDWVVVKDKDRVYQGADVIIALHNRPLSPYNTYQGLANPDVLCI